jgi:hypothetical protein
MSIIRVGTPEIFRILMVPRSSPMLKLCVSISGEYVCLGSSAKTEELRSSSATARNFIYSPAQIM